MRTIKFRGKRLDGGWVEGDLIRHYENQRRFIALDQMAYTYTENGISRLVSERFHEVLPESVGQWTGLVDLHGNEIYEGDIVKCVSRFDMAHMIVLFEEGEFRMVLCEDYDSHTIGMGFYAIRCFEKEVIGNIIDSPELMEVE